MKTRNSNNFFYASEELEPRLYPLVKVQPEILKECLKDITKLTGEFSHLKIPKWKRTDTLKIQQMLDAKEKGIFIAPNNKYLSPPKSDRTRGPKPRRLRKIPVQKRVKTPPISTAPENDKNSPPEQTKIQTRARPLTQASPLRQATPPVFDLPQNQTMSTEKAFKPIDSSRNSQDSPTDFDI